MFEPVHGRGGHADHEQIQSAIAVKIGQGVRHAEGVRVWNPGCGDISELAFAVVLVKIETGKVTDDNKVQIAVVIQIRERSAVRAAPAFVLQA